MEVCLLLSSKLAAKYSSRDLDAIKSITVALKNQSLQNYDKTFEEYNTELQSNIIISGNVDLLADALHEKIATLAKNACLPSGKKFGINDS